MIQVSRYYCLYLEDITAVPLLLVDWPCAAAAVAAAVAATAAATMPGVGRHVKQR